MTCIWRCIRHIWLSYLHPLLSKQESLDDSGDYETGLLNTAIKMTTKGRNVILLLDNEANHHVNDLQLTNVYLHFLQSYLTHRCRQSSSTLSKHTTGSNLCRRITCAENDSPQTVDLRETIHMMKIGWDPVSKTMPIASSMYRSGQRCLFQRTLRTAWFSASCNSSNRQSPVHKKSRSRGIRQHWQLCWDWLSMTEDDIFTLVDARTRQ